METTVKQRLVEYLKHKGIGQNRFERMAGLSIGYIAKLRIEPSPTKLRGIINAAPDLNERWLLTGEGSMLNEPQQAPDVPEFLSNAVRSEEITDLVYAAENKHGGIFYRDGRGQLYMSAPHAEFAARGEFPNEADSLEPNGEWTREVYKVDKVARGRYISFTVLGNSMDNGQFKSLRDGDKVLTRELERDNWRTLRAGDHRYWVIVFDTSVLIKEIASFDAATGNITCHSLNPSPEYHDFTLNLDNVRHLFYGIRVKPGEYEI